MAKTLLIPLGGGGGGGERGYQGVQGAVGAQGATGLQGADGVGYQGVQGEKGESIQGWRGFQGVAGLNGIDGLQGERGESIQGADGAQGAKGESIQGSKGFQGIAGESVQGATGAQGTTGFQGIMGLQGPAGGGGGSTRYDISTKSQEELADFYQNWQTVMASNDVYVGIYPVISVIPEYTVEGYTAMLLEYNTSFGLEEDETTETILVTGYVGAYYILPNGMGDYYGTDVTLTSKGYVDAVVSGIQSIQGIQGTAGQDGIQGATGETGLQGATGFQGATGIQGASGGGTSKIELLELSVQDLVQFYQDTLAGTMKDFSQYTANGYPLINAYRMTSGWVVDTSYLTGVEGTTYTTDGTEVAIVMNQKIAAVGTIGNETFRTLYAYLTLFSPTIYQTYGASIDMEIEVGYSNVVQLQFVLADDSIVNYTMPLTQW